MTRSEMARPLTGRTLELGTALGVLLLVNAMTASAAAQGVEPRSGDTVTWHTVVEGETLQSITEKYLGIPNLWPENLRLNPQLKDDPNLLRIGQRLRVISERDLPVRSAEVVMVQRRVDQKPATLDWLPAREGDLLNRDDALRTLRRSSAELSFDDGTNLKISEESMVFLRQAGRQLTGVTEQTIEIVDGEADLEAIPTGARPSEIEIIVAGATARPEPGAGGRVASRLRKSETGAAVMVYDGKSAVESGGQKVDVPTGMGTAVEEGAPPSPPERLLPAPTPRAPAPGEQVGYSNPLLEWTAVAGAVSYTAEICSDARCASLVDRAVGLTETSWRPSELPAERLYWRVRGVSESGLDGYPNRPRRLQVTAFGDDLEPPTLALRVVRPGRSATGEAIYLGPGGAIELLPHDDVAGVDRVELRWNDGVWRSWRSGRLRPPAGSGEHVLELRATDRAGRRSETWRVQVERLEEPPAPPTVSVDRSAGPAATGTATGGPASDDSP